MHTGTLGFQSRIPSCVEWGISFIIWMYFSMFVSCGMYFLSCHCLDGQPRVGHWFETSKLFPPTLYTDWPYLHFAFLGLGRGSEIFSLRHFFNSKLSVLQGSYEKQSVFSKARTGYPFIDAIMTQLRTEGWIHHLARHAVACFLTRGDLWLSWEEGQKVISI